MADATDLLRPATDLMRQIRELASAGPFAGADAATKRAADLLEQVVQRQLEFERALVGRAFAPASVVLELVEQTSHAMRAQSAAFGAAAAAFQQASELMELQANLMESAVGTVRDPAGAVKNTARAAKRRKPAGATAKKGR